MVYLQWKNKSQVYTTYISFVKATECVDDGGQERMIVRGGGRACNFAQFGNGRNNPPVLFLEGARKHVA